MKIHALLAIILAIAALLPECCHASEAVDKVADALEDGDEYYDLENMSDEALEEICTSRGFELVREVDEATGEPLVYTHQDYVDAASECLQIEEDLEEILQTHPEILEDVQRENERMMQERDRLLEQLQEQNATSIDQAGGENDSPEEVGGAETVGSDARETATAVTDDATPQPNDTLTYDFKDITMEVIAQMKADLAKVVNFVLPKDRREKIQLVLKEQIQPALKSFAIVAKDMGMTAYDMARRYLMAFMNKEGGEKNSSNEQDAQRAVNIS